MLSQVLSKWFPLLSLQGASVLHKHVAKRSLAGTWEWGSKPFSLERGSMSTAASRSRGLQKAPRGFRERSIHRANEMCLFQDIRSHCCLSPSKP